MTTDILLLRLLLLSIWSMETFASMPNNHESQSARSSRRPTSPSTIHSMMEDSEMESDASGQREKEPSGVSVCTNRTRKFLSCVSEPCCPRTLSISSISWNNVRLFYGMLPPGERTSWVSPLGLGSGGRCSVCTIVFLSFLVSSSGRSNGERTPITGSTEELSGSIGHPVKQQVPAGVRL